MFFFHKIIPSGIPLEYQTVQTFCRALAGSKLFAKIISKQLNSPLARKYFNWTKDSINEVND